MLFFCRKGKKKNAYSKIIWWNQKYFVILRAFEKDYYMNILDGFYRIYAWVIHRLTAKGTKGNGIHSPHLFYLVNMLFYDKNPYYCFREIETQRAKLLCNKQVIHVDDYGSGKSEDRVVTRIAKKSLASPREAQLLFRLVEHLKPKKVLELGTSLGITTVYLAKAADTEVITLEGSKMIQDEAEKVTKSLDIKNVNFVLGDIDEILDKTLMKMGQIDFVFMDANHTKEATLRYFNQILAYCKPNTVIALDDIHYSREMNQAWQIIQQNPRVTTTMDLYELGLVFFDEQYLRKHYRINIF